MLGLKGNSFKANTMSIDEIAMHFKFQYSPVNKNINELLELH